MVTYSGGLFVILKKPDDRVRYVKDRLKDIPKYLKGREIQKLCEEMELNKATIYRYLHKKI